jgi:hypothetical protein
MADMLREAADRLNTTADELLEFLDSPGGRRLRRVVATGLILSVPLIMRIPGLKRTPLGRLVELAGGATLIVKLAEVIRDWERGEDARRRRAIDVQVS